MCLATPVRIKRIANSQKRKAIIEDNKSIDISLVPAAKVGEWLLCHGNLAINKISAVEAGNILGMIKACQHNH